MSYITQVLVMKDGAIECQGKLTEVKKTHPDLYESWRKALKDAKAAETTRYILKGECKRNTSASLLASTRNPFTLTLQNRLCYRRLHFFFSLRHQRYIHFFY